MRLKKIEAMHSFYGFDSQCRQCGQCPHFIRDIYHDRMLSKCTVYGCTHSEATDWRRGYTACGLIDKPFPEEDNRIIDILKREQIMKREEIPGQITFF